MIPLSLTNSFDFPLSLPPARNLAAKDRNGKSDPFVVISLPGSNPPASTSTSTTTSTSVTSTPSLDLNPDPKSTWKKQTPIVSKSLDPEWKLTETTYDLPILSKWLADAQLVSLLESKRLDMARGIQDQEQHEGNMASSLDVTQASEGSEAGAGEKLPTPPLNTTTSQDVLSTDTLASGTGTGTGVRPSMSRHSSKLAYLSSSSKKLLSAPVKLIKVPNRLSRNNSSNQVPFHSSSNSHSEPEQFTNLDQDLGRVGGRKRAPRPMTIRRRRRNQGGNLNGGKDGKGVKNPSPNGISQGSLGNVEFVLWDHDRFSGNDYLGEVSLDILKWSRGGEGIGSKWEDSEVSTIEVLIRIGE